MAGRSAEEGKMGDPVFDAFAKTEIPLVLGGQVEEYTADAMIQLLDLIGQPVIFLFTRVCPLLPGSLQTPG